MPRTSHLLQHLGTKTPYEARLHAEHPGEDPETCAVASGISAVRSITKGLPKQHSPEDTATSFSTPFAVDGATSALACEPIHVYKVVRHGTRYPTEKHMRKLNKVAQALGVSLDMQEEDAGLLTSVGDQELEHMGRRLGKRFPSLFEGGYHPVKHDIQSSQVTRALQSASAFSRGLFGSNVSVAIRSETKALDRHMRFHKACPRYAREVKKNSTLEELGPIGIATRLINHEVFANILDRIESVGLRQRFQEMGAKAVVRGVWDLCVVHLASLNMTSPACALLSESDVELLSYLDDVESFWLKGYGFRINYEMACPLVQDIARTIKDASSTSSLRRSTLRFGHAETIIPLVARLGLFLDESGHEPYQLPCFDMLSSDDEATRKVAIQSALDSLHVVARRWRSGRVSPFAANVAFVLYRCKSGPEFVVELMHNEDTVPMPPVLCAKPLNEDGTLCAMDDFLDRVYALIEPCNFDDLCSVSTESN